MARYEDESDEEQIPRMEDQTKEPRRKRRAVEEPLEEVEEETEEPQIVKVPVVVPVEEMFNIINQKLDVLLSKK